MTINDHGQDLMLTATLQSHSSQPVYTKFNVDGTSIKSGFPDSNSIRRLLEILAKINDINN